MERAAVTTHILDLESGSPAAGILVVLTLPDGVELQSTTDSDGRIEAWGREFRLIQGDYQLTFEVGDYFQARSLQSFYQSIPVSFRVDGMREHCHVPLLLSPFGYSTYRGS